MSYIKVAWNDESDTCHFVPNYFYSDLWSILAGTSAQNYEKWSFFSDFRRLGSFTQVFGQVKKSLMLELHKLIKVSHEVACPIVLILFYEGNWQGGLFKIMKNDHFLVLLAVWVLFPYVFGQVNKWSMLKLHEMIRVLQVVAFPIISILFEDWDWQGGVLKVDHWSFF